MLFYVRSRPNRNRKWHLKTKWIIRDLWMKEIFQWFKKDDDDDDYNTPKASRIDETSLMEPATTEARSNLRLRQKVKRDKLTTL